MNINGSVVHYMKGGGGGGVHIRMQFQIHTHSHCVLNDRGKIQFEKIVKLVFKLNPRMDMVWLFIYLAGQTTKYKTDESNTQKILENFLATALIWYLSWSLFLSSVW